MTSTPPATGLREALEEAITWPSSGALQHAQAGWRKVAAAYDAAPRAESVAVALPTEDDVMARLSSDNPKSRTHGEKYADGLSSWKCIPIRDVIEVRSQVLADLRSAPPALDAARISRQAAYDALPRDADDSMYELADKVFDALSTAATPASGEPAAAGVTPPTRMGGG